MKLAQKKMKTLSFSFHPSFHVEITSLSEVLLFTEKRMEYRLQGDIYVSIAKKLIENPLSFDEVALKLQSSFPIEDIYYALFRLQKKNLIEPVSSFSSLAAYCSLFCNSSQKASKKLQIKTISIHTLGSIDPLPFQKACKKMQIQCSSEGDLALIITDHYRRKELKQYMQKPCMLVSPLSSTILIGPLFLPGKTACFDCLSFALENNQAEAIAVEKRNRKEKPIPTDMIRIPIGETFAASIAANEVFKWIVQEEKHLLENGILSFCLSDMQVKRHQLLPRCGCLSTPSSSAYPAPFKLDHPTHSMKAEITYEKYKHLISPLTGIVDFLKEIGPFPNSPIHSYFAGMNLADVEYIRRKPLSKGWKTASGGKGSTPMQAKTSCLAEAIERHSGVYQGREPRKKASYEEIQEEAIHPYTILQFSEAQYEIRDQWNQDCDPFHFIPSRFSEKKQIDWTPIWSLTHKKWKWIPTALCFFGYPFEEEPFCKGDSNGCAAGNSKVEAILSALLEVVERDAIALWWYPRLQKPSLDLKSFKDPYIAELLSFYKDQRRTVWALDLSADINIPTFAVISSHLSGGQISFGFGSHLNAHFALLRALNEMNQCYTVALHMHSPRADHLRQKWFSIATTEKHPYLLPSSQVRTKSDYPYYKVTNYKKNLLTCKKIIERAEMEILILDQTRDYIQMPVFRAFIPGMRHFWNRYAPGRLYDVPLKMGWVKKKLEEKELNPIPMFI